MQSLRILPLAFAMVFVATACSSSDDGNPNPGSDGGTGGDGGSDGPLADAPNDGDAGACGQAVSVELTATNLVLLLDRSASMDDGKWDPTTGALKAFVKDPASQNLYASLDIFGQGASDEVTCNAATYQTPQVALVALPSGNEFATALDSASPGGNAPTQPALHGALAAAATLAATRPTDVVLLTDGLPGGCEPANTTDSSVDEARTRFEGSPSIRTFVIGIVPDTATQTFVDAVASAGGTEKALVASGADPQGDVVQRLGTIREMERCGIRIPTPPEGKPFSATSVNVDVVPTSGPSQPLAFGQDCAAGVGWHYDSATKPTSIQLCPDTCTRARGTPGTKLSVTFGCATRTP